MRGREGGTHILCCHQIQEACLTSFCDSFIYSLPIRLDIKVRCLTCSMLASTIVPAAMPASGELALGAARAQELLRALLCRKDAVAALRPSTVSGTCVGPVSSASMGTCSGSSSCEGAGNGEEKGTRDEGAGADARVQANLHVGASRANPDDLGGAVTGIHVAELSSGAARAQVLMQALRLHTFAGAAVASAPVQVETSSLANTDMLATVRQHDGSVFGAQLRSQTQLQSPLSPAPPPCVHRHLAMQPTVSLTQRLNIVCAPQRRAPRMPLLAPPASPLRAAPAQSETARLLLLRTARSARDGMRLSPLSMLPKAAAAAEATATAGAADATGTKTTMAAATEKSQKPELATLKAPVMSPVPTIPISSPQYKRRLPQVNSSDAAAVPSRDRRFVFQPSRSAAVAEAIWSALASAHRAAAAAASVPLVGAKRRFDSTNVACSS